MKPQQLANLLGVDTSTLRRWSGEEYKEFLSPTAAGGQGVKRNYSEHDARIIAWIAAMKAQNIPADEISTTLQTAKKDQWGHLPPLPAGGPPDAPIAVVPREAVEERVLALRERYDLELKALREERDALEKRLSSSQEENKTLHERITEIATKEAELRGKLEQYQIGGYRMGVATLITVAALAGVLLTLILLVLLHTMGR